MKIVLYIYIYIIGVVLGSFFTLAIHRIPRKQDITHTRSYCPNCNHRLNFLDLIPVLSYIFLGGKCRYCHEKIRPRYLIIEVLSGIAFLLFVISLNIDILNIEINKIALLVFGVLFISTIFMILGIFKEYKIIEKSILTFGVVSEIFYITYLYIFKEINIYRYIIYSVIFLTMLIINMKLNKEKVRRILFIIFLLIGAINIINILI
jgi:leader peptidase (prepilin peptidase)/N-methyltransferase